MKWKKHEQEARDTKWAITLWVTPPKKGEKIKIKNKHISYGGVRCQIGEGGAHETVVGWAYNSRAIINLSHLNIYEMLMSTTGE